MAKFNNTYRTLPAFLFEDVRPTPIKNPKLIHVTNLLNELDLVLSNKELLEWLNGERHLPGEQRLSSRYAGHQFGVWAGQLGDGRAMSLGEIKTKNLGRQEVQTKGSGLTPFSRMGDGKAVIRSSVREYLCSEAMFGLGIPTTRVLALMTGEDPVHRETIERSALIARVFPSNLRFGHFELCFHFKKDSELKDLIEYTKSTFFPDKNTEEMLFEIVNRTAKLIANWQDVGFCHGVMNTDNMSILGLTIDYGPFGFLEDTKLNYICNHSDPQGRYAYNHQPSVAMWNLERFLVCFMNELPKEKLEEILAHYSDVFETELHRRSRNKIALCKKEESDFDLFLQLIQTLDFLSIDYTYFFRNFLEPEKIYEYYGKRQELIDWYKLYDERLKIEVTTLEDRRRMVKLNNPKFVLRSYIAQEVIEDVERGSSQKLETWLKIFYDPFSEHSEFEKYANPTPPEHKDYVVSCSS